MKIYELHGMNKETGDDIPVQHFEAESHSDAFKRAEAAFPGVWFFSCKEVK